MSVESIVEKAVGTQWEVFTQHSARTEVQLRGLRIEAEIEQEKSGYGVRVITPRVNGAGVGFASCNSPEQLQNAARTANELAMVNRSPFFELPEQSRTSAVTTIDRRIVRDRASTARDYAEWLQATAPGGGEVSLTFAKVRAYVVDTEILNSRGLSVKSKGTYLYLELALKVDSPTGATELWPTRYARRLNDLTPSKIIPHWVQIAKSCYRRHTPKTRKTTVIFAPPIVCDVFVPTIGFHASAESVQQGLSAFKQNAVVASGDLSIDDDGLYPYGLRTNSFDDEGHPQRRTKVIGAGVFKGHLYDQLHAHTMNHAPTGNGIKPRSFASDVDEKFQVPPSNLPTNLSIRAGNQTLEELIGGVKDGLLIHQAAWIDPDEITTNFGAEIRSAQEIVNGQLGEGVVGGTMSGRTLDLINRITGISDTAEIVSASSFGCVAPYIRFSDVNIAGPT